MTIQDYIAKGYTIVSEGEQFVTLKKEKGISFGEAFLFSIGIPLMFFGGAGLICWILAFLNYAFRSEKIITIKKG